MEGTGYFFAEVMMYPEEDIFIFFATNRSQRKINQTAFQIAKMVFDPEYEPLNVNFKAKEVSDLPSTPVGIASQKLVDAVLSGNRDAAKAYIDFYFSDGLKKDKPMEDLLGIFEQLHQEFQGRILSKIMDTGTSYELIFTAPNNENLRLAPEFNQEGKLIGVSIEGSD